jgi:hypothetical protein
MKLYIVTAHYRLYSGEWQDTRPTVWSTREAAEQDAQLVRDLCWRDVAITEVTLDKH